MGKAFLKRVPSRKWGMLIKRLLVLIAVIAVTTAMAEAADPVNLTENCIAHYKMNDNDVDNATVVDSQEYSPGTLMGGKTTAQAHVDGIGGGALSFNGTSDYIDTGDTFESTFQSDFTVNLWVKLMDGQPAVSEDVIMGVQNEDLYPVISEFIISLWPEGYLAVEYIPDSLTGPLMPVTDNILSDGENSWIMITAIVRQSGEAEIEGTLYVNGSLCGTDTLNDVMGFTSSSCNLALGAHNFSNEHIISFTNCYLDNVMIFNKALTTDEITFLYNDTNGTEDLGEASYLKVTGTATMTAGTENELTITAYQPNGSVATTYTGSKSLTFSGPANAPNGTVPTIEGVNIGSATTVNFTNGVSNTNAATLIAYKAETTTVDVSDGSIDSTSDASYDLDLTVNPASANNLNFDQQPTNTVVDTSISPAITVEARDQYNNVRTNDNSTSVAIAINNNPGSGTLSGTTSQTASSGIATFNDLNIDVVGVGYTLDATSAGLTKATSGSFRIMAVGTATWTGGAGSTDWDTAGNWDIGSVPDDTHTVIIADVTNQPALSTTATVADLTINSGATFDLNGKNLTATGTVSNNGTVQLEGGETVTWTNDTDSGTVKYDGSGNYTGGTGLAAGDAYFNLEFNNAGGSWDLDAALDVDGTFELTNGTFDMNDQNMNVAGNFTLASGTTFTKGTGTLIFDGDLNYADNTSPQQDIGAVAIGTSPDTTTLTTDMNASSLTINEGDTLVTDGYNLYISGDLVVNGTLDASLGTGGDTTIQVGGDWIIGPNGNIIGAEEKMILTKDANKKEVNVGEVITYTITIENNTPVSFTSNVTIEDTIPGGFKYIDDTAQLDGSSISNPTGNRPLSFNVGTIDKDATKTLKYQLVVGSGVTFGNYENTAVAKSTGGTVVSNKATETVKVIPDPLFDLGNVIGKVFHDRNENGIQDPPQSVGGQVIIEEPIPNIQIATEDGTLITTDGDGKYHLAGIIPGRHLFRLDERTLPEGSYLTTDKVVIVDITPGILSKVNFGVNSNIKNQISKSQTKNQNIKINQQREKPIPRLNASLFKDELVFEDGKLLKPAEFRIFTNYSLFIDKWKLEILDKDTKTLVKRFEGGKFTINEPVYWDGKDKDGKLLRDDRSYVYVLSVTGKDSRQDITKERGLIIREQRPKGVPSEVEGKTEKEIEYRKWLEQENKVNNLDRQNIKIEGETIKVSRLASEPVASVKILKSGKLEGEIPVVQSQGITPSSVLESPQSPESQSEVATEIILPKGEYDIEGQHIKVGEDYLFFVAMGDAKAGYTFNRGNIEPVQQDDKFKEGFWSEGKMAYYLKGKIKGKYLITSSLDTERDKKELFKNLDPDKYYPVYGDSSSINYGATNTQGMLYLLVEWDKSSAIWGNYNTAFTDTEFAAFNRTLYGGKLHYESVSTTQFGEPKQKFIVFRARAQQKAAHNEFVGTGGSLYYLKNKDVIEGSDKVKVEVRDKITGLVLTSKEMKEGVDYEIDYSNGRIVFWRPVSQIVESDSIISSSLLGGNPVYVLVDYEYEVKDKYDEGTIGGRLQQSLTDYLSLGGTYVKEEQLDKNYELKGTDAILHLGKDIKFIAEYAQSQSEAQGSFISTDGGLSFTELATADLDKGKAYGLKGEAHLLGRLGLTGYYKQIEKGFSSTSTTSQQGKELIGMGATFDITPKTRLKVSHDIQKLIDDGNLQTQLQVGAQKTETTTAQITHQMERLRLTGEYRHQGVTEKKEQFESQTNTEEDTLAAKADYKATEKVTLSLEQQATLKGSPNHQTTAGVTAQVNKLLSLRAKETVGTQGTATGVGATANVKDRFELSSDYTRTNYKGGGVGDTASLSGRAKIDDKTEVHTMYALTDSTGGKTESVVYGSKRKINDHLSLATDKTYAKNKDKLTQGNTYGLTREKNGKKLEGSYTSQVSQGSSEVSNTNIFGLSGDINDKWAASGSFERGAVQNHDGTQSKRNAGAVGIGFVDKDQQTQEVKLKASSKLELRLDDGQQDKRQFLIYNAVEGKINPNTTLFAKANLSQTKNTTTDSTEAQYKEFVTGLAYRPINFDRLNLLGKYTYLEDDAPSGQSDFSDIEKEKSHTLAGEAVYDLTNKWQLVEKLAYKMGEEKVSGFDFTKTQTWLMIHRLNYNINKDWQVGAEYRRLTQKQAKDYKQGALVEVARKVGEFIQVGLGYNFTDFNDDLTHLDYTSQGPFIRFTVKFYDRTPEEIERRRQLKKQQELQRKNKSN